LCGSLGHYAPLFLKAPLFIRPPKIFFGGREPLKKRDVHPLFLGDIKVGGHGEKGGGKKPRREKE